jgi:hypothetical protein
VSIPPKQPTCDDDTNSAEKRPDFGGLQKLKSDIRSKRLEGILIVPRAGAPVHVHISIMRPTLGVARPELLDDLRELVGGYIAGDKIKRPKIVAKGSYHDTVSSGWLKRHETGNTETRKAGIFYTKAAKITKRELYLGRGEERTFWRCPPPCPP